MTYGFGMHSLELLVQTMILMCLTSHRYSHNSYKVKHPMFSTLLMQIRNQLTHTRLKEDLIEHIWQKFSTQQHQADQE